MHHCLNPHFAWFGVGFFSHLAEYSQLFLVPTLAHRLLATPSIRDNTLLVVLDVDDGRLEAAGGDLAVEENIGLTVGAVLELGQDSRLSTIGYELTQEIVIDEELCQVGYVCRRPQVVPPFRVHNLKVGETGQPLQQCADVRAGNREHLQGQVADDASRAIDERVELLVRPAFLAEMHV